MKVFIGLSILLLLPIVSCSDVNGVCYVNNSLEIAKNKESILKSLSLAQKQFSLCFQYSGKYTVNKENCRALGGEEMEKCPTANKKFTCDGPGEEFKIIIYEGGPGCDTLT
jgi:hypothetical protein